MIKVLHVTEVSAANPWLNGLGDHHSPERFHHSVATLGPRTSLHESAEEHGLSAFALNAPSRAATGTAIARLVSILKRERIQIIQTHLFYASAIGLIAGRLARTPLRILTRHHADFTTTFNKPVHRTIDRWQAHNADRVWVPSAFIKQCMVHHERVPEDRIAVLPHGYDFRTMRPQFTPDERARFRHSLGGRGRRLIGTVARLVPEKGHRFLIEAIPQIIRTFPEALFLFVGAGPHEQILRESVRDLRLGDYVRFLGWRDDPLSVIEALDLVVHPSLNEPFGNVFVESMAMERPIVATREAGALEILEDEVTGVLVPSRDPTAIAREVVRLLGSEELCTSMGRKGRTEAKARFGFPQMIVRYEQAYIAWLDEKAR